MIKIRKRKNFNIGIEFLRIILSFLIVVYHVHSRKEKSLVLNFTLYFLNFYTSTFFLMSFYFSFKSLSSKDINIIKERLQRIILPYIFWPIIIFLDKNIYNYINHQHMQYSIGNLIVQLIVGRKINDVFWFQFNLIFISTFIILVLLIFSKKKSYYFLIIILFFSIVFNYKGYNQKIFSLYNITIYHSIGRLSIYYIYAIIGFFLGSYNILGKLQIYKFKINLFFPIFLYLFKEHKKIYQLLPKGLFLINCIFIIGLFISFGCIPFDCIFNKKLSFWINKLTGFTGGIYYIHFFIYECCKRFSIVMRKTNLKACIIVYLLSYLINLFFYNIFQKTKIKYLFI